MVRRWSFHVKGTAAGGVPWSCSGEIDAEPAELWNRVMIHSFHELTEGRAIYGKPGVACKGPYEITSLHVERIDEAYLR